MRKPEKPRSPEGGRRLQLAEVEIGGVVDHLLRHAVLDDVDRDRRRVDEAAMQRLERKAELLVAPDRGARHAPDRRVLLEGEAREDAGQGGRVGRLERLRSQLRRHVEHRVGGERNGLAERLGGGRRRARRRQRRRKRAANGQLQKFATLPVRHPYLRHSLAGIEPHINGPTSTSPLAKMKFSRPGHKRVASPARSVLDLCGCIWFFAAQRDAFCRNREMADGGWAAKPLARGRVGPEQA